MLCEDFVVVVVCFGGEAVEEAAVAAGWFDEAVGLFVASSSPLALPLFALAPLVVPLVVPPPLVLAPLVETLLVPLPLPLSSLALP